MKLIDYGVGIYTTTDFSGCVPFTEKNWNRIKEENGGCFEYNIFLCAYGTLIAVIDVHGESFKQAQKKVTALKKKRRESRKAKGS